MAYLNIGQWLILLVILNFTVPSVAQERLRLGVPQLKPFTYLENASIKGTAIGPVKQALTDSHIQYEWVFIENYSLLLKALRNGSIDGYFIATQNAERDKYADFSKPIFIDHYSWFILDNSPYDLSSSEFKMEGKIGAIDKTNSHRSMIRRGFQVYGKPPAVLAQQFIDGTLDAIFASEGAFTYQLDALNFPKELYSVVRESERSFGIYISKKYLNQFPDTLTKINQHIKTQ
jgi:polar amino acid transport system substrate-binding protein